MKTLKMTVLVHEGPMARAYLGHLKRAGLKPERIILMVNSRHATSGKTLGRWMPSPLRAMYLKKVQEITWNSWPRRIKSQYPWLVDAMVKGLREICAEPQLAANEITGTFEFKNYCKNFEQVVVTGYRDPVLESLIRNTEPKFFLFTGGGIMPSSLLDIPGTTFLHVHPGFLPDVRGADGLLWSMLSRGAPGATCFHLAEGIDCGDIVAAADFPPLTFDIKGHPRPEDKMLYRAIFSFFDPILRAELLVRTLAKVDADLEQLPAEAQDLSTGITYHFMHERIRHQALKKLFHSSL